LQTTQDVRHPAQSQLPKLPDRQRFFFSSIKKKPFILNTHGSLLGYKKYLPTFLQRFPYRVYDLLTLKASAKRADAIVVSSKMEFEDAVEFGVSRNKLHIIPMGVDIPAPPSPAPQEQDSPLKILFVGRIARVRRVELILQAVKKLSIPYSVTIVGGEEKTSSLSKTGYLDELRGLSEDLGISDHVTFAGPKPPEELPSYYRAADVFVYPSLYENFAQPILEAASYGVPVIATPVGIAQEIIEDGETGFLTTSDPTTLARRLEQLADPSFKRGLGEKLKETVRNKFAWNRIMDQYVELYRSF
jgi:glycosyltransferase involved in cell wall biosynthesis